MKSRNASFIGVVAALLVMLGSRQSPSLALQEGCGVVHQSVEAALQTDGEADVIISLQALDAAPALSIDEVRAMTAQQQDAVLASVSQEELAVTIRYSVIPAIAGVVSPAGAAALACHPYVLSIDPDYRGEASLAESSPLIRADDVHLEGFTGSGVNVAVLDSGIDTDHADLAGSIVGEQCTIVNPPPGWLPCPNDPSHPNYSPAHPAEDGRGHGTRVSGVITSDGNVAPQGIAPGAGIYAYKWISDGGGGKESWALAALDDIARNHIPGMHAVPIHAVNMSFHFNEVGCDETTVPWRNWALVIDVL